MTTTQPLTLALLTCHCCSGHVSMATPKGAEGPGGRQWASDGASCLPASYKSFLQKGAAKDATWPFLKREAFRRGRLFSSSGASSGYASSFDSSTWSLYSEDGSEDKVTLTPSTSLEDLEPQEDDKEGLLFPFEDYPLDEDLPPHNIPLIPEPENLGLRLEGSRTVSVTLDGRSLVRPCGDAAGGVEGDFFTCVGLPLAGNIPAVSAHPDCHTDNRPPSGRDPCPLYDSSSLYLALSGSAESLGSSSSGPPSPTSGVARCPLKRRVRDQDGYIRRAACVCLNEQENQVLLITSKNEGGAWLIPGGGLEKGEEEEEAAVREAWEEAGVRGQVTRHLGIFQYEDDVTHKKKRTSVFVMHVTSQTNDFPEASLGRVRSWFSKEKALDLLARTKPHQASFLQAL